MSIQNRLLVINTTIFGGAFLLFAIIVYILPQNRLLAEIDLGLDTLAAEVLRPENRQVGPGGMRIALPQNLANFETASTFLVIIDVSGSIVARSNNLVGFEGLLDPDGLTSEPQYHLVRQQDTLLRVLTIPLLDEDTNQLIGYLQVARLLDNYESFSRVLIVAVFVGFAAVAASLFLAIWLTPSLFKPLEDIAAVARQITRADDLSRRVPDTGRTDEIGVLANALNQTLERLERLFQMQQRLLADVSHELRTPLTAIRGNLDLMRRMGTADPESVSIIQEEVDRMTRLVGDLLLLARADAGSMPLDRKQVELDNLLFEVYRQVMLLPKSVDVILTEVDQVCVLGDVDRLKQLTLNLIDNAIKYTPSGGKVTLKLSKTEGWARLDITDTGIGIPPEDLPYIFDRFYRVDKGRNRKQGGSGLGLSIAKWIAQAHGGNIRVTSQVGQGSTFSLLLPILEQKNQGASAEELEQTRPGLRLLNSYRRR